MNVCIAFGFSPAAIISEAKVWRHSQRDRLETGSLPCRQRAIIDSGDSQVDRLHAASFGPCHRSPVEFFLR